MTTRVAINGHIGRNVFLVSNILSNARDEEIVALLKKFAPELECVGLWRVESKGSRPAVLLSFTHVGADALENLSRRLSGTYWKGRILSVSAMPRYASAV